MILFENQDGSGSATASSAVLTVDSSGRFSFQTAGPFEGAVATVMASGYNDGTNDIFSPVKSFNQEAFENFYFDEGVKVRVDLTRMVAASDITIVTGGVNVAE